MRTIQAIVLTVSFHDGADSEELSLAILRWEHVTSIRVDHTGPWACPRMHRASKLVRLVKRTVDQVCSIIICVLIEAVQERSSRLWQELDGVLLARRRILLVWEASSPSITISLRELLVRIVATAVVRIRVIIPAKLLNEPLPHAHEK